MAPCTRLEKASIIFSYGIFWKPLNWVKFGGIPTLSYSFSVLYVFVELRLQIWRVDCTAFRLPVWSVDNKNNSGFRLRSMKYEQQIHYSASPVSYDAQTTNINVVVRLRGMIEYINNKYSIPPHLFDAWATNPRNWITFMRPCLKNCGPKQKGDAASLQTM